MGMINGYFFFAALLGMAFTVPAFAETYYAKIENGIITNVIVADKSFVDSQPGTWIQTFKDTPGKQYAGIGYAYNGTDKKIIPIEKPDTLFKTMKSDFTLFLSKLSSGLDSYYHPKIVNSTSTNQTATK